MEGCAQVDDFWSSLRCCYRVGSLWNKQAEGAPIVCGAGQAVSTARAIVFGSAWTAIRSTVTNAGLQMEVSTGKSKLGSVKAVSTAG